jgi:SAM-dependent methyltransferase
MLEDYYRERVEEYEEIYYRDDPVRQEEQRRLAEFIKSTFSGKEVLEVAAGTGYWTQFLSQTARRIVCTDAVPETLEVARKKTFACPIEFREENAYQLSFANSSFESALAMFWFSHVPKRRREEFLVEFHRVLRNGAPVLFADNIYDPAVGGTLVRRPQDPDTYKLRRTADGREHLVLKNYFTLRALVDCFSRFDPGFTAGNVVYGKKFWYACYQWHAPE